MISESAQRLKVMIEKAIDDGIITPEEYDQILEIAGEDNIIDVHEKAHEIVLSALSTHAVDIDEIIRSTTLSAREVRIVLLELELAGHISHDGAQCVRLNPK